MLIACLILITWQFFSALNGRLWPLLKQIFSYLISAPFITGHPYQFHKVSRFPVRQVHFWRRVTCSTIAVALITPSLLTRPYPFTLWPLSRCFLDVPVLRHLLMRQGWGFYHPPRIFLHPIYGFDILLFPIPQSLLKALQALRLISAHYFMCTVFWRILDGAFILAGGVKGANAPFGLGLGLL